MQQQYQPYILKPTKLKSIPKPLPPGSYPGINGEKMNLNKYGNAPVSGVDKQALYEQIPQPVSRTNQMSSLGTGSATGGEPAPRSEVRKIYKKRVKASASVGGAGLPAAAPTRNEGSLPSVGGSHGGAEKTGTN